jgi:hypothetical protein
LNTCLFLNAPQVVIRAYMMLPFFSSRRLCGHVCLL